MFAFACFEDTISTVWDLARDFTFLGAAISRGVVSVIALFAVGKREDAIATNTATDTNVNITNTVGIGDGWVESVIAKDLRSNGLHGWIRRVLCKVGWIEVHDGLDIICSTVVILKPWVWHKPASNSLAWICADSVWGIGRSCKFAAIESELLGAIRTLMFVH